MKTSSRSVRSPAGRRTRGRRSVGSLSELESEALVILCQKEPSAAGLMKSLGVSLATVNRILSALRKRGLNIVPVREKGRWHYEVRFRMSEEDISSDPLVKHSGCVKRWMGEGGRSEDEIIYGERRDLE